MIVMVAQIAQPGLAFATLPACVLSFYGVAVVLREEIRSRGTTRSRRG